MYIFLCAQNISLYQMLLSKVSAFDCLLSHISMWVRPCVALKMKWNPIWSKHFPCSRFSSCRYSWEVVGSALIWTIAWGDGSIWNWKAAFISQTNRADERSALGKSSFLLPSFVCSAWQQRWSALAASLETVPCFCVSQHVVPIEQRARPSETLSTPTASNSSLALGDRGTRSSSTDSLIIYQIKWTR